ncbi:hypothetical protein [Halotia branconii]|uniref:Uncharacterized protein n=1 Tax=Halotia branconii CENA392 TaxID=1539056 RepID=A0AAJ6NTJ4_9CYAN|nr:hypothetical protein [Halotia branconii]WGV26133.1 hypothetical protein QI031_01035 [Halotia branconii CENA392]
MDSETETQICECEARLYNAMSASDVSELDLLIAAAVRGHHWTI